jgi:hypothetical protein
MTPQEPPLITRRRGRGALPGMPGPTQTQGALPEKDSGDPATAHRERTPVAKRAAAKTTSAKALRRPPAPLPAQPAVASEERDEADRPLSQRGTLARAGAGAGYMITVRLPEPLHQRYRRLVRALGSENTPASVTAIVHVLLANGPQSPADTRALVRRWRAVLDVGPDEAPDHPYIGAGKHATTLRVDARLRDHAMNVIDELDEQRFRTSLNEVLQALMHFGPDNAAEARRLLESRPAALTPKPKRPSVSSASSATGRERGDVDRSGARVR